MQIGTPQGWVSPFQTEHWLKYCSLLHPTSPSDTILTTCINKQLAINMVLEIEDYPDLSHWKSVLEFSVEKAALLMAGIDPLEWTLQETKEREHPRWKNAHANAMSIESAIRQGLLSPVICRGLIWQEEWNNPPELSMATIKHNDRDAHLSIQETIITRASLIGWIDSENVQLVRPIKQINPPVQSINQPDDLQQKHEIIMIDAQPPVMALPYLGHRSEGLEFVEEAIQQFWSTYDENDPSTAPTREEVSEYLIKKGASVNMADAINLILRPFKLRTAGLKNKKVPTRKDR